MADSSVCGGEDAAGVAALLERVAGLMDGVQATQQRMEERQLELESTVRAIQAGVAKLATEQASSATSLEKLLEKTCKVSRHVKDVRVRVENQNLRVKKVETTQGDLLAKNKFRVVIYQVSDSSWGGDMAQVLVHSSPNLKVGGLNLNPSDHVLGQEAATASSVGQMRRQCSSERLSSLKTPLISLNSAWKCFHGHFQ